MKLWIGKPIRKKAQVSLEIAFSLIAALLLLWGAVAIFIWANNRLIVRQESYESSPEQGRVAAGNATEEVQIDESGYANMDILEEGGS